MIDMEVAVAEDKVVQLVLKDLKKKLGDKTGVSMMGEASFAGEPTEFFTTGLTLLDRAIRGGWPIGRLSEIAGDVAVGKTVLLLTGIAQAQKQGALCFYLDAERASSTEFTKTLCGVDNDNLVHLEPETQEDLWQAVFQIISSVRDTNEDRPIFIGVDSLAAVGPRAEKEMSFDEEISMALAARIIRRAMRKLTTEFSNSRVAVVFTNHEISRINVPMWAEKTQTWGGSAPKYHSSVRVKLDQIGWEKRDNEPIGAHIRATVRKNRFDPPGRQVEYTIYNRGPRPGIDDVESIVNFLNRKHLLGNKTGYVEWDGKNIRKSTLIEQARTNEQVLATLRDKALAVYDLVGHEEPDVVEGA